MAYWRFTCAVGGGGKQPQTEALASSPTAAIPWPPRRCCGTRSRRSSRRRLRCFGARRIAATAARRRQSAAATFPLSAAGATWIVARRPHTSSRGRPPIRAGRRPGRCRGAASGVTMTSDGRAIGARRATWHCRRRAGGPSRIRRPPESRPAGPRRQADAARQSGRPAALATQAWRRRQRRRSPRRAPAAATAPSVCRNWSMALSCLAASALPSTCVNSPSTSARLGLPGPRGNSPSTNCDKRISLSSDRLMAFLRPDDGSSVPLGFAGHDRRGRRPCRGKGFRWPPPRRRCSRPTGSA